MIFGFADYTLNTERIELRRLGRPVRLRAKPFDVLAYLLIHHQRAVSKQELFEELWPDVVVGDATLNSCIKEVRQALGDTGAEQRIILTLRGRGYRVITGVTAREGTRAPDTLASPAASNRDANDTSTTNERADVEDEAALGEHKLVTVLACQMIDSPSCFQKLNVEERHRVLHEFRACVERQVQRFGGAVYRSLETGALALFGAPKSLEAHARHAVLAAEEIRRDLRRARESSLPERTADCVSMGLESGRIVISASPPGRLAATSVEGVLESAIDLQRHAPPGAIVLGGEVERLARRFVRTEVSDARPGAHVLLSLKPLGDSWLEAGAKTLSRFVNRDADFAVLRGCLDRAEGGRGQVVSVVGEPGVGKSRLLHEFRLGLAREPVTVLFGRCLEYQRTTPYAPLLEILRHHWDLREWDEDPETADRRIQEGLADVDMDATRDGPIARELLGVGPRSRELIGLDPKARKQRCFDVMRLWLERLCQKQTVLVGIEDLQWIDPTSEEWLRSLVQKLARMRLMVLVSFRPGYSPTWMDKSYATQKALAPLPERDAEQIARQLLARDNPDPSLLSAILRKAEGNPLFIEELARRTLETGDVAGLPATLEAVLAARIDQAGRASKHVLQTAAVIGRIVPEAWLKAVCETDGDALDLSLAELESAELLVPADTPAGSDRAFPHALIQEAALQALFAEDRKNLHRRVAETLEDEFPETAHAQPQILAQHFTEAGRDERAVPYWHQAGKRAAERGSLEEAINHLNSGIATLHRLPESEKRDEQEIVLLASLGPVWSTYKGLATPGLARVLGRLQELGTKVHATPRPGVELIQLFTQRKLTQARKRAEELLADARALNEETAIVETSFVGGIVLLHLGEAWKAFQALEQAYALYDPNKHQEANYCALSIDLAAHSLSYAGMAQVMLGYLDQGRINTEEAIELGTKTGSPMTVAAMHYFHAIIRFYLKDIESVTAFIDTAIEFSERNGIPIFLPGMNVFRVCLKAMHNHDTDALPDLRRHWRDMHAMNGGAGSNVIAAPVLSAHLALGRVEDGRQFIKEALHLAGQTQELVGIADLNRFEGEFHLAQPGYDESSAQKCYESALRIARRQETRLEELRAAVSLCRLLRKQGKADEGRRLLEPLYNWFTEGFDKPDLKEAKALLDSFSS